MLRELVLASRDPPAGAAAERAGAQLEFSSFGLAQGGGGLQQGVAFDLQAGLVQVAQLGVGILAAAGEIGLWGPAGGQGFNTSTRAVL